jgi:uncharacterized protein (DUF1697 family)
MRRLKSRMQRSLTIDRRKALAMSAIYLALLRGINVGGKNKLPMHDLRDLFTQAGCRDVRTYIQSGNVIFSADPATVAPLSDLITTRIAERFGYRVPLVLRTAEELGDVIRHNPFIAEGAAEDALHVLFLAEAPDARRVAALDPDRSPPDAFAVRGQEIYLRLPNGAGRTKLTNGYFDTKLAAISTGRNWRTVTTLFALMN